MNHCSKRIFLLLLTVKTIINTEIQGLLLEPKVPRLVGAHLGSNTTISCSGYTDVKRLKVKWYFGKTSDLEDQKRIEFLSSNLSGVSRHREAKGTAVSYLTILNVTFDDAGWYFCEVTQDIPRLNKKRSNGSELLIYLPAVSNLENITTILATNRAPETPNASPWWLWVALAVGCASILTTIIITTVICRRKKGSPVYENTKEASDRHRKKDRALHHCKMSSDYTNMQMDTHKYVKPHKYESYINGRRPSPKYK